MAEYIARVQATSNSSANTEDEFVELRAAASTGFLLKRVRISCATAGSDVDITARIASLASGTAGSGTAFTPLKKRPTAPAATTACTVKTTTTALALGGTPATLEQVDVNGRSVWEWVPRGDEEYIDSGSAGIITIAIKVSAVSIVLDVTVEFEE